ncbi:hypothetical protein CR513_50415, partial [Mucuna pruriens]
MVWNCTTEGLYILGRSSIQKSCPSCNQRVHISNFMEFKVSKYDHYIFVAKCTHDACNWRCRTSLVKKTNLWKIKKLEFSHTCVATIPIHQVLMLIVQIKTTYKKAWLAKQKEIKMEYNN